MVAALQQNMSDKVTDLRDELTHAQLQCQRMKSWGVRVMGTRHTSLLLRETWAAWKTLTGQGEDRQACECRIQMLALRFLRLRSHRAFNAWWDTLNVAKLAREQAEKACRRMMHQQLAACFGAWQDAVIFGSHARETLARAVSSMQTRPVRAAMRQWVACVHASRSRVHVCDWMAVRSMQRQVACMFRLWHQMVLDADAAAASMSMRLQRKRLAAYFAAWIAATNGDSTSASGTGGAAGHVLTARIQRSICRVAFCEWRRIAARKARNREVVVRRYDVLAKRLQRCTLEGWKSTVLRRRRGRRIIDRCMQHRRQKCKRAVLGAWCGVKEGVKTPLADLELGLFRRCAAFSSSIRSRFSGNHTPSVGM